MEKKEVEGASGVTVFNFETDAAPWSRTPGEKFEVTIVGLPPMPPLGDISFTDEELHHLAKTGRALIAVGHQEELVRKLAAALLELRGKHGG